MVQPPLSMGTSKSGKPPFFHKTRSVDTHDRRPIERALVAEGVHRDVDLDDYEKVVKREDTAIAYTTDTETRPLNNKSDGTDPTSPNHERRDLRVDPNAHRASHSAAPSQAVPHTGKGQAHDPLSDHLYLNLGSGASSNPPSPPVVCESPPAAQTDIYETAYRKEVERIRASQGRSATLFLTRRVEKMEGYFRDQGLIKGEDGAASKSMGGLSKVIQAARSKAGKDLANEDEHGNDTQDAKAAEGTHGTEVSHEKKGPETTEKGGLGSFSRLVDQARAMGKKSEEPNNSESPVSLFAIRLYSLRRSIGALTDVLQMSRIEDDTGF